MPTASLRILVVETDPLQRLNLEKLLNQQGYHRIAPVASLEECLSMLNNAIDAFDLLLINATVAEGSGLDLERFCNVCPVIRNALIYRATSPMVSMLCLRQKIINTLTSPPDDLTLDALMLLIDRPDQNLEHSWQRRINRA